MPQSTVRILFSILGDIIFFDYYSSVSRRDGTFECVIVYRELSEARLAAKLDGTELGDRCLEVRMSHSIDRFDIAFSADGKTGELGSRTLLIKCEEMSCTLDQIQVTFPNISRSVELERDLGAGLPPLSARFFLSEFQSVVDAETALKSENSLYTLAEAHKHMQSYSIGNGNQSVNYSANSSNTRSADEVLIYGVPASKLLDPTTTRSYPKPDEAASKPKSSTYDRDYDSRDRERGRDRYDRHRDHDDYDKYRRRRSRSRSAERRRR